MTMQPDLLAGSVALFLPVGTYLVWLAVGRRFSKISRDLWIIGGGGLLFSRIPEAMKDEPILYRSVDTVASDAVQKLFSLRGRDQRELALQLLHLMQTYEPRTAG